MTVFQAWPRCCAGASAKVHVRGCQNLVQSSPLCALREHLWLCNGADGSWAIPALESSQTEVGQVQLDQQALELHRGSLLPKVLQRVGLGAGQGQKVQLVPEVVLGLMPQNLCF